MSPSPIQRLKPYFKPRPRAGARARATKPPATTKAPAATQAAPATQPAAATQPPTVAQPAPDAAQPAPATRSQAPSPAAPAADLHARRERLARRYLELQADLGGLVYEMAIRDHFRLDVVVRRAAELQAVDAELSSVEQQLGIATTAPITCPSCGGPVQLGAQYCGRCGSTLARSAIDATPVSAAGTAPAKAVGPTTAGAPS